MIRFIKLKINNLLLTNIIYRSDYLCCLLIIIKMTKHVDSFDVICYTIIPIKEGEMNLTILCWCKINNELWEGKPIYTSQKVKQHLIIFQNRFLLNS